MKPVADKDVVPRVQSRCLGPKKMGRALRDILVQGFKNLEISNLVQAYKCV